MLKDKTSSAIVAVSDLARARNFYETVLGLDVASDAMGEVAEYRTGATRLMIYASDYAGTNQGNAVVWDCGDDIDDIVATLKQRGVTFEHYEGMERDGDVHVAEGMRLVWLKDPDGNILHLTGE